MRNYRSAAGMLCLSLLLLAAVQRLAAEPAIVVVQKDGRPVAIDAVGMPADRLAELARIQQSAGDDSLARVLTLRVASKAHEPPLPAMAGSYEVVEDALRFTPRFSLKPGMKYEADFFPPPRSKLESPARVSLAIDVPALPAPQPEATARVFPSSLVLPENQLRFYLQFSRPMSRGGVYQHIHLLKSSGEAVDLPFLEIGEELWDTSGQRLTLLIDPGRIKRGLKPREESGPVLEAGETYILVVDPAWQDADRQPMKAGVKWKFLVGPPVEKAIDPAEWKIEPPKVGSDAPLRIQFPRPLDQALLLRTIDVVNAADKSVAGTVALADRETVWTLRPDKPWLAGQYSLVVDTTLEDLAGNRIGRAFEVDVAGQIEKRVVAGFVKLPFQIAP